MAPEKNTKHLPQFVTEMEQLTRLFLTIITKRCMKDLGVEAKEEAAILEQSIERLDKNPEEAVSRDVRRTVR